MRVSELSHPELFLSGESRVLPNGGVGFVPDAGQGAEVRTLNPADRHLAGLGLEALGPELADWAQQMRQRDVVPTGEITQENGEQ